MAPWETGLQQVSDHTSNGKTVAVIAEFSIKISHQEVVPRSQALWDWDFTQILLYNSSKEEMLNFINHVSLKII